MKRLLALLVCLFIGSLTATAQTPTDLLSLTQIHDGRTSRHASSYDTSGGNGDFLSQIKTGEKRTLLDVKGAGVITRFWVVMLPPPKELSRNDIILRMYWDGKSQPSVEAPIGAFFGQGWDESYVLTSAPLAVAPGRAEAPGLAMTSYFAMPFSRGARIEIENQTDKTIEYFYYNIDYVETKKLPANTARFHAWFNRQITPANPGPVDGSEGKNTTGADNYLIADIKGHGQFVGVNYYVQSPTPIWYGEGDEMVFIDGEKTPSMIGTGTEDYFNMAWCPTTLYMHPYFGLAYSAPQMGFMGRFHYYRFHIADPIYFDRALRFTIEHGHANNLTLDLATVAYWYQSEAVGVPAIPDKKGRDLKPPTDLEDVYMWQEAWRKQMGGDLKLWGDEWRRQSN